MDIQNEIMDEYCESRVGTTVSGLVEEFDGTYYTGRSYAESPDIDGHITFTSEEIIDGDFARVLITGVDDGEPVGIAVV